MSEYAKIALDMELSKKAIFSIILAVILLNIAFGLPRLARYAAVDEPYWTYARTPKFWNAIENQKWRSTQINDKPGVTVAIISGAGLLFSDPMQYKSLRFKPKTAEQTAAFNKINFSMRLPIYLFNLLMLVVFYFLISRLLGKRIGLTAFTLTGLSPIILGISLIINPDSLLWIFSTFTLLSFFIYQKEGLRTFIFLAGLFLGLALLTKYVANILFIYLLLAIFLKYIFYQNDSDPAKYFGKSFLDFGILILASVAVFFILFPAAWVNSDIVLQGTIMSKPFESNWQYFAGLAFFFLLDTLLLKNLILGKITNLLKRYRRIMILLFFSVFAILILLMAANVYSGMKFYDFEDIIASPKSSANAIFNGKIFLSRILADYYSLFFGLVPISAIFFLFSLYKLLSKKFDELKKYVILSFSFFIFLYYLASTVSKVTATVRYQIALYPLAIIIASIGLVHFFDYLEKKTQFIPNLGKFIPFMLILIILPSIALVNPHFFSYSSLLLPEKYLLNYKDMGDGSFEAAEYLNQKENANKLVIWSDKGAVCEAFAGRCATGMNIKELRTYFFDYFVVSSGRKSKFYKRKEIGKNDVSLEKIYDSQPEKEIIIDGRPNNYVKVSKPIQ